MYTEEEKIEDASIVNILGKLMFNATYVDNDNTGRGLCKYLNKKYITDLWNVKLLSYEKQYKCILIFNERYLLTFVKFVTDRIKKVTVRSYLITELSVHLTVFFRSLIKLPFVLDLLTALTAKKKKHFVYGLSI